MAADDTDKPLNRRQQAAAERRQAILDAGFAVFSEHGFAAARLDDVAERAGVAKGTIYLSFRDKEDLFEQIVLGEVTPVLAVLDQAGAEVNASADVILRRLFDVFRAEILGTRRKEIARLVFAEGPRFPKIAEFYHREVITRIIALISEIMRRAQERGELASDSYARYPQLVVAPIVMALIWDSLFSVIAPLDVEALLEAHRLTILRRDRRADGM